MKNMIDEVIKFRDDRDWKQFHKPENLAKSIVLESAELLEHFQWDNSYELEEVKEELADVMAYCILMADVLKVDIEDIVISKMKKNSIKYPVDKSKGKSDKYNKL